MTTTRTDLTINVTPLRPRPDTKPAMGRPKKLEQPSLPDLEMDDYEQQLFDFFINSFKADYRDLKPTDLILLHLAAIEYVKYLRVAKDEMASRTVLSQARQHPATNMLRLLDMLSTTRKDRKKEKATEPANTELEKLWA